MKTAIPASAMPLRIGGLVQDLFFSARGLSKAPGLASIAILTLALGIAGIVVIFSFYNAFYLRPFPFVDPGRLVDLNETAPQWNADSLGLRYTHFHEWREHNRTFEGMAAWGYEHCNVAFNGDAERVRGAKVTQDLATVLGIRPVLGRMFLADEDRPGGADVVVLGHGLWQRRFSGSESVIGQSLHLNGEPYEIVGVLPPDGQVLVEGEFWVPLRENPAVGQGWMYRGVGRLKQGVELDRARADLMQVRQGMLENDRGDPNSLPKVTPLGEVFFGGSRRPIQLLLGAVATVLLIACGNVAALMLARGLSRSREFALRLSLGAPMYRIARLILIESLMLAGLGGLGGLLLGHWGVDALLASLSEQPPRWVNFDMDWRVWVFAGGLVVVSAILGAIPVIGSACGLDLHRTIQSSARQSTPGDGGRRALHALVVAEVALTLVLLAQAGLLVKTFRALRQSDPGYRPQDVIAYEMALPTADYGTDASRLGFFRDHLERVRGLPGVLAAGAISAPPLSGHWGTFFTSEDAPPADPGEQDCIVLQRATFPGYFDTMGISLLQGRGFEERDGIDEGRLAVIVNETFANRFWPGREALGQRIRHRHDGAPWMTVVGVARDVQHYGPGVPMIPGVYIPYRQLAPAQMAVVVRGHADPSRLIPAIRMLVRETDANLAVFGVDTLQRRLEESLWMPRLCASLFAVFGAVALCMALGGMYGVFSYVVNRRTPEIGLRMALGAQRREVLWLVLRQGMKLAGLGIGVGLLASLPAIPLMHKLLYGVSPADPLLFGCIALILAAVAMAACWLPARRAATVNPMEALRWE